MPVGCYANNTSAIEAAIPKIPLRIDARTVRESPGEVLQEGPAIFYSTSGGIVVVNPDGIFQRVPEVEATAIGTPGDRIGDAKLAAPFGNFSGRDPGGKECRLGPPRVPRSRQGSRYCASSQSRGIPADQRVRRSGEPLATVPAGRVAHCGDPNGAPTK